MKMRAFVDELARMGLASQLVIALRFDPDGWASVAPEPDAAERIHVRVRHQGDHLVITDMYIHAPEITPEILRGISVSRLQATLNATLQLTALPKLSRGEYSVTSATEAAAVLSESRAVSGVCSIGVTATCLTRDDDAPEPSLAELRQRTPVPAESPKRQRLTRPDGVAPEEFYPRVAAAYSEYAPRTRAPAKEMATEAGVPVTTVHRWIREARRRGFLTPAMKGKAG